MNEREYDDMLRTIKEAVDATSTAVGQLQSYKSRLNRILGLVEFNKPKASEPITTGLDDAMMRELREAKAKPS